MKTFKITKEKHLDADERRKDGSGNILEKSKATQVKDKQKTLYGESKDKKVKAIVVIPAQAGIQP